MLRMVKVPLPMSTESELPPFVAPAAGVSAANALVGELAGARRRKQRRPVVEGDSRGASRARPTAAPG
jgi:hypothetical protein